MEASVEAGANGTTGEDPLSKKLADQQGQALQKLLKSVLVFFAKICFIKTTESHSSPGSTSLRRHIPHLCLAGEERRLL